MIFKPFWETARIFTVKIGKYFDLIFKENYFKICYLVDIYNGQSLDKNGHYSLPESLDIYRFGRKNFNNDVETFKRFCEERQEYVHRDVSI